jgi:hypothetical protein
MTDATPPSDLTPPASTRPADTAIDLTEQEPNPRVMNLLVREPEESSDVPVETPISDGPEEISIDQAREGTRGDLARGLLWILMLTIGGVIVFVGLGRIDGTVLTQTIFPSLVTLAGTALGFYFGSQSGAKHT